jgi:hypothetical protein
MERIHAVLMDGHTDERPFRRWAHPIFIRPSLSARLIPMALSRMALAAAARESAPAFSNNCFLRRSRRPSLPVGFSSSGKRGSRLPSFPRRLCAAQKWVGERDEVGPRPDRKEMTPWASSSEMTKTRFDKDAARGGVGNAVTSDGALFLATLAFGLAMLALLSVLALADVVGAAGVLPFFALPTALFLASALLLWRWTSGEREEVAVREIARPHKQGREGGAVESISRTSGETTEEIG